MSLYSPQASGLYPALGTVLGGNSARQNKTQLVVLDFRTSLPQGVLFSRGSVGTCTAADGKIVTASSGQPRFDYDPVTHAPRGVLLEPGGSNLVTSPVPDANWTGNNATLTPGSSLAPDGNITAATLTDNSTSGNHSAFPLAVSCTLGVTYTLTLFYQPLTEYGVQLVFPAATHGTLAYANFNTQAGTVGTVGSALTDYRITPAGTPGWWRLSISAPATATAAGVVAIGLTQGDYSAARNPAYVGTGTGGAIWGMVCEPSLLPTSYIPGASRAADVLAITGLAGLIGTSGQGTVILEGITPAVPNTSGSNAVIGEVSDGTAANRISLFINAGGSSLSVLPLTGGAPQPAASLGGVMAANTLFRAGVRWNGATSIHSVCKGASITSQTATNGEPPGMNRVTVSHNWTNGSHYTGCISRVILSPLALPDAQFRALCT